MSVPRAAVTFVCQDPGAKRQPRFVHHAHHLLAVRLVVGGGMSAQDKTMARIYSNKPLVTVAIDPTLLSPTDLMIIKVARLGFLA
jgi:hypothetical protein